MQTPRAILIIFLLLQFLPANSFATAGFAETSWVFHYSSTELVEWNHGDVCTADAPTDEFLSAPAMFGKNCFCILPLPYGSPVGPREFIIPLFLGFGDVFVKWEITAANPRPLYLCTAYPLFIIALFCGCFYFIVRRVKRGKLFNHRSDLPLVFMAGIGLLFAGPQLFSALRSLFPVSPTGKTSVAFLGLLMNDLIVVSPLTLWFAIRALVRRWNSPGGTLSKTLAWGLMVVSVFFAPLLLVGPPSIFYFFFLLPVLLFVFVIGASAFFLKWLMRSRRFSGSG